MRAATVQAMLSVLQGRGIACMCAFGVSVFLVCVGRRARRACRLRRGLERCGCGSPGGPESPPVLSHFPERIVFVLSEEERPARREVGPQLGGGGVVVVGMGAECYDTATPKWDQN